MSQQRMIRLGIGVLLALSLIGFDTAPMPEIAQAQRPTTFDCTAVTEIPQQECEALVAFYVSTDGDNWINHSGWLRTNTPCTWFGLTCSEGHVTRLELNDNYLHGPIPSEIENLSYLQVLILYANWITGSIPPEIGNLLQLRELSLDGNALGGLIPVTLGNLTNLQGLYLTRNQLTGPIPRELGKLVNVGLLMLHDNQLSGPIPSELGNMTGLWILALQNNQLNGSIPSTLGQLVNLCDLDLSVNQLSGSIPPELGNLTRIGWCRYAVALHDTTNLPWPGSQLLPAGRPPQPNIGYLNLAGNHLSGAVPVELGQLSQSVRCEHRLQHAVKRFALRSVSRHSLGFPRFQCSHGLRSPGLSALVLVSDPNRGAHQPDGDRQQRRCTDHPELDAYCLHRTRGLLRDQLRYGSRWAVHGVRPDREQDGEFSYDDFAAARHALLLPFAHDHRTARQRRQLRGLLCVAAEHCDQRVHRGGGQRRWRAHPDPHAHAHLQPDRHGYTNRDRYCDAYPHRNGYRDAEPNADAYCDAHRHMDTYAHSNPQRNCDANGQRHPGATVAAADPALSGGLEAGIPAHRNWRTLFSCLVVAMLTSVSPTSIAHTYASQRASVRSRADVGLARRLAFGWRVAHPQRRIEMARPDTRCSRSRNTRRRLERTQ